MVDVERLTKETIDKGGVLAMLYFDLHGTSKEILTQLGAGFVQKLLKEPGVVTALGEIDEPLETEDKKTFSTSVEVKLLVKDFNFLANICALYSPFGVEILKPNDIKLNLDKAQDLLMNFSNSTFEYKKYILDKISSPADVERYRNHLKQKAELGKKLLEKKDE
ncbi:hypothetical protein HYT84_04645 [Candidatus Micrarchaeota archaeon]|nr:hypothetical protein [Candidatus Micrarchaeota archaeon]